MTNYTTVDDVYPSIYLSPSEISNSGLVLTIKKHDVITFGPGDKKDQKIVLSFVETDKKFSLTEKNAHIIARLYGKRMDNWVGKTIELFPEQGKIDGKPIDWIRIKSHVPDPSKPF